MNFRPIQKNTNLIVKNQQSTCCNQNLNSAPWISGFINSKYGMIPVVKTDLDREDYKGHIRSRISSYRDNFTINPGLYAVGNPDTSSHIFVTANYKMSFDLLRKSLKKINGWILVLNTGGINVWCAAGKGTFSTEELIKQIKSTHLKDIAPSGKIILPQLGAPGINIVAARKATGFNILYGPVKAQDIPEFLQCNYKANSSMRRVTFSIKERAILIPIELFMIKKKFLAIALIILIYGGLTLEGIIFNKIPETSLPLLIALVISIISGTIITPLLLPYIPFRSFALKGAISGLSLLYLADYIFGIFTKTNPFLKIAIIILGTLFSSYTALQFTGSTPFTSLSGVKKEVRFTLPIYISAIVISIVLLIINKAIQWSLI